MIRAVMFDGSLAGFQAQPRIGEQWREVLEAGTSLGLLRVVAVDAVHLEQSRILLVAAGWAAEASDVVALAQPELTRQFDGDVGVVATGQIAVHAQEPVTLVTQVEVAGDTDRIERDHRLVGTLGAVVVLVLAALSTNGACFAVCSPVTAVLVAPPTPATITRLDRHRRRRRPRRPLRRHLPHRPRGDGPAGCAAGVVSVLMP